MWHAPVDLDHREASTVFITLVCRKLEGKCQTVILITVFFKM